MREVTVKIGLERIDTQEGITVEVLLDSRAMGLVMSSEFARKQGFKLKKLERLMQVRNVNGSFNKEGPIENTVEVNIYYQDVICKSTCLENYIPVVIPPLNPISLPSTVATFLATRLMAVLQPSGYSVFHGGDTLIQLSLL